MGRLSLIAVALGAALLFGSVAHAQQQPASPPPPPPPAYGVPITLEQARAAIAAGEAESKKNGWNHVFAVVDGGLEPKISIDVCDATLMAKERRKKRTALARGRELRPF
jgi:hypothetical protein